MTGRVVERDARTAYRSASVPSTGVSEPMPPHSQGAERRRGHRAGRTGSRWGLRALVIGGLAGAAWLLTGAAAHAADRDPAGEGLPLGSSLIGSVVPGDGRHAPLAHRIIPALEPLDSGRHRGSGPAATLAGRLLGTPAPATRSSDADPARGGIVGVVRGLTAPLHLAGEAVDTRIVPVIDPPEPGRPPAVTAPVTPARPSVTRVNGSGDLAADTSAVAADRVDAVRSAGPAGSAVDRDAKAQAAGPEPDRQRQAGKTVVRQHALAADRHWAAVTAAEPETVSETPDGDGPAPLRVHLGAANGVPASGSSTATEGGSAAILPAKVADSTVACHRLPITTDVEARRHDAEAPTVSPD
ncbi:hypothetical protein GCM10020358_73910 [Amorphoplanes nipponensis]|uniref:Uncharacterized protein n=2 Tax=Actinoplanes nipponensis TaxID=135950 RepID=A0A919MMF1_9ACTN|nr:hypothetical protein Ani05nite_33410 [Actinoplanes nipponensis]